MAIDKIRISKQDKNLFGEIKLDGSKSISNRVLIIQALCEESFNISGLSKSDDTKALQNALGNPSEGYNVGHAGTTFRFLTAYLSLQEGTQILTGSDRMQQRPVGPLVDALNDLGANVEYLKEEGYPPLAVHSPEESLKNSIALDASISSQFITALCLIAPVLPQGLKISLEGEMVSRPYIEMTLKLMKEFGVESAWIENTIEIKNQEYLAKDFNIEADWSAASYYYLLTAIADEAEIRISGLWKNSLQGDSAIAEWGHQLGVETAFAESEQDERQIILTKSQKPTVPFFEHDFLLHPDIAQTIAVLCAAKGIQGLFSGLQTLKIKETDRIEALKNELLKFQVFLSTLPSDKFAKKSGKQFYMLESKAIFTENISIETYHDHRMAMAFAPLGLLHPIEIADPKVVSKSYPSFWEDLKKLGFKIDETS